ncbi:MAG: hypothetical protein EON61_07460 [Alphaproteobacteria bacterium]|nr:MAG: hypothetical protein EON61_07460 [Alphaproteobacteria bacterium]
MLEKVSHWCHALRGPALDALRYHAQGKFTGQQTKASIEEGARTAVCDLTSSAKAASWSGEAWVTMNMWDFDKR